MRLQKWYKSTIAKKNRNNRLRNTTLVTYRNRRNIICLKTIITRTTRTAASRVRKTKTVRIVRTARRTALPAILLTTIRKTTSFSRAERAPEGAFFYVFTLCAFYVLF